MNRKKGNELLKIYGNPAMKINKTILTFARQKKEDIINIEQMKNEKLINEWKGLCVVNYFYDCVSLNELQRISLIELEMQGRKIDLKLLKEWYEKGMEEKEQREIIEEEQYNKEKGA